MKNILSILICYSAIWSCSNRTADNSNSAASSATENRFISQTDTSIIQVHTNFPFGCIDLAKYKYPKHWEGDLEHYGQLKKPKGKEFDDIGQCFNNIHVAKTISSPKLKALELLRIGDNFKDAYYIDTLLQNSTDSCRYRLPNIGIYECYYAFQQNTKRNAFGLYGNLLLVDPKTKKWKAVEYLSPIKW